LALREGDLSEQKTAKTPDSRYLVVRGRLWRTSNPALDEADRRKLVHELMDARRDVKTSNGDKDALADARRRIHQAKVGLRERGEVWWCDGAPDFSRRLAKNTPYAEWFASMEHSPERDV
jgi:hypothetical protein